MPTKLNPEDQPLRLYILDFGLFKVHGGNRIIAICGYLIETRLGRRILVDTGFPAKYAIDAAKASAEDRLKEFGEVRELSTEHLPSAQLGKIGLRPSAVDCLIITHTHIDHVGAIADFPDATLLIGAAERALPKPLYWGEVQPMDWPEVETTTVSGDLELCDGLRILSTPGHSPGHLSVLVTLPKTGPVLLTADAISHPSEVDERFAGSWDPELAIKSADRILRIATELGAFVIYGHSPEQWPQLRKAPQFYD
ncbi:N-acyl homoserine lactonase family protein [Mesorhizobium sp. 10J20-29]